MTVTTTFLLIDFQTEIPLSQHCPEKSDTILLKCLHQFKRCLFLVDEDEIHRMANSSNVEERIKAADQLRDDFTSFPDKAAAWSDLHRLTQDEDSDVRFSAANALLYIG